MSILFFLSYCFSEGAEFKPFHLEKFLSEEQIVEYELFDPQHFTFVAMREGRILIINRPDHSLRLIDAAGNSVAFYQAHGNGPGELHEPHGALPGPDYVAVFNRNNGQFVLFNHELEHLENMKVPYRIKFAARNTGGDYFALALGGKHRILHINGDNFKIKNKLFKSYMKFDDRGRPEGANTAMFDAPYFFHFYSTLTKAKPSALVEVFAMNDFQGEGKPLFLLKAPGLEGGLIDPLPFSPDKLGYIDHVIYVEGIFVLMMVMEGDHDQELFVYDLFDAENGRFLERVISQDLELIRASASPRDHFFMRDEQIFRLTRIKKQ
jgi:hypothetical protein